MTLLYLVRHGQTAWNLERRIQGRTDIPLNATGLEQAARAARVLAGHREGGHDWAAVYTSPLARARQTAEIVASELHLAPPRALAELTERDYGEAEGQTRDELSHNFPGKTPVPGRESRAGVVARVAPVLERLAAEHPEGGVLVVSHGGVIRALLSHLDPRPGAHHEAPIANGSVHTLRYRAGRLELVRFDDPLDGPREAALEAELAGGADAADITLQNALEAREGGND